MIPNSPNNHMYLSARTTFLWQGEAEQLQAGTLVLVFESNVVTTTSHKFIAIDHSDTGETLRAFLRLGAYVGFGVVFDTNCVLLLRDNTSLPAKSDETAKELRERILGKSHR